MLARAGFDAALARLAAFDLAQAAPSLSRGSGLALSEGPFFWPESKPEGPTIPGLMNSSG